MFSICYICFKLYLSQDELMVHFDEEHKVNLVLKQFLRFKKNFFSLNFSFSGHAQQVHPQPAVQQGDEGVLLQRLQQVHGGQEEPHGLPRPQSHLHQDLLHSQHTAQVHLLPREL